MLTEAQKEALREFLERQGLSFKPLLDEMVDHIGCDLEERMAAGASFQEAWDQAVTHIPGNHFHTIQQEVMETINKRFTWSQFLSFSALGLIFISAVFKILHLQFAGEVLVTSFAFMAAALLTGSLSGIFLNKGKRGAMRVLAVIVGVILLLAGFAFRFLHLPGADQLTVLSVVLLIIALVVNSLHVYKHASGEGNLLTYLHEKYTPGIERFFMLLLLPLVVYKAVLIAEATGDFLGNVMLLVVIVGAGLQFIVTTWRVMENQLSRRNPLILMATLVCCLCLVLPFLGQILPIPMRVVLVGLFSPIAGWLAFTIEDEAPKSVYVFFAGLVSAVFLGWALIRLGIIPAATAAMFFNIPVLILLVVGVFIAKKHRAMRAFMLVSVAGYLFEYIS